MLAARSHLASPGRNAGVPAPGLVWGPYPERADAGSAQAPQRAQEKRAPLALRLRAVQSNWDALRALDDNTLELRRFALQHTLARERLSAQQIEHLLALAAEVARRTLGKSAYEGQLRAALHLLDERLVEMATGEGKSLATALAAAVAALAGMPVHVVTANDYLVARDAEAFRPLFEGLGLRVAAVITSHPPDVRRQAYAQPVVYVTARELVFDYLRDRVQRRTGRPALQLRAAAMQATAAAKPLLRGLCMALVDEADSVLIDEAQMPLVLSREHEDPADRAALWQAWALSDRLVEGEDFVCRPLQHDVRLTEAGREHLARLTHGLAPAWRSSRHREHAITVALVARHVLARDRDYIVQASPAPQGPGRSAREVQRIAIVDAVSGRPAEGRRWSRGLHAMVALKEGLRPEPEMETLAQITYQRFFRRYHRLAGLSGTLREAASELRTLYGLSIATVPPRLPLQRQVGPVRVFTDSAARWAAVRERCAALQAAGRPVLVGTDSVADARALSAVLNTAGLAHAVLDARQDADEAAIVARAGEAGRITVATNMAGRGTDIEPDEEAQTAGGLHVLSCQLNPSRRLDRQLIGRAARQGQPGSAETWLSLDARRLGADAEGRFFARLLAPAASAACTALPTSAGAAHGGRQRPWHAWTRWCLHALQLRDERRQSQARTQLFRQDCQAERGLAFAVGP